MSRNRVRRHGKWQSVVPEGQIAFPAPEDLRVKDETPEFAASLRSFLEPVRGRLSGLESGQATRQITNAVSNWAMGHGWSVRLEVKSRATRTSSRGFDHHGLIIKIQMCLCAYITSFIIFSANSKMSIALLILS